MIRFYAFPYNSRPRLPGRLAIGEETMPWRLPGLLLTGLLTLLPYGLLKLPWKLCWRIVKPRRPLKLVTLMLRGMVGG